MTPSFIGLIATMFPGVRPSMSLASLPTASTRPLTLLMATIDGSLTTMPLPRAYTQVLAVPRSIARSLENNDNIERRLTWKAPVVSCSSGCPLAGAVSVIGGSGGGLNTVLAGIFDCVHRFVGGGHQLIGRGGHIGQRGDADRRRQVDVEPIVGEEFMGGDAVADALAHGVGAFPPGVGQDDSKLIATEA